MCCCRPQNDHGEQYTTDGGGDDQVLELTVYVETQIESNSPSQASPRHHHHEAERQLVLSEYVDDAHSDPNGQEPRGVESHQAHEDHTQLRCLDHQGYGDTQVGENETLTDVAHELDKELY